ncbi:MAG: chemotaxis response regulator protein-glutamate methylesterase [Spirochaetaceae bacterium]|jgi:two-component system chemotaxis response regulator CheB|nr:chemotaxis response regulator protein-glutamate methylesterase [Spirochaetaceae bacterium]
MIVSDEVAVLVVDDSALMRNLISRMIEATPGLRVAERAMNGVFALQKIPRVNPDIIVLDLEMPEMNGIEFLKERKRLGLKIPVIILSSIARRGAEITMEALALGASDFIMKPTDSGSEDVGTVKETLTNMLLAYGSQYRRMEGKKVSSPGEYTHKIEVPATEPAHQIKTVTPPSIPAKPPAPLRKPGKTEVIAIGISTGGPDALRMVFANLDADLPTPIVVVQHMPAGFTLEFAKSLDRLCPLEVKEAEEGDLIRPGRILIAQGNRHLEVERKSLAAIVHLTDAPLMSGHRPSADVLFASVAKAYSNHALGVIMTGMGRDGAENLGRIYQEGGITLGQDEATAVVYGMPRVAYELGHVMEQVPLDKMANRICSIAKAIR